MNKIFQLVQINQPVSEPWLLSKRKMKMFYYSYYIGSIFRMEITVSALYNVYMHRGVFIMQITLYNIHFYKCLNTQLTVNRQHTHQSILRIIFWNSLWPLHHSKTDFVNSSWPLSALSCWCHFLWTQSATYELLYDTGWGWGHRAAKAGLRVMKGG